MISKSVPCASLSSIGDKAAIRSRKSKKSVSAAFVTLGAGQSFLQLLALGDVFGNAGDAIDNAVLVLDREGPVANPADPAIGLHDAVIFIVAAIKHRDRRGA